MEAFPEDLKLHKNLTPAQRQMWLDKASLAACGRNNESVIGEPIIYFIAADELVKIGHTTNLSSRLRSLRTASPDELRILLVKPGTRGDEQDLHRRFSEFRISREWFKLPSRSLSISRQTQRPAMVQLCLTTTYLGVHAGNRHDCRRKR
jgi:hypothetical protein